MAGLFVKIDVGFWQNPKVLKAGERAAVMYLHMLCYCKANLTDGFVPDEMVGRLGVDRARVRCMSLADTSLIERSKDDDGWQIVGWSERNRTRAEVNEIREERRSAGSKGGKAKAAAASKRLANCQEVATTETYPEYIVHSSETETEVSTSSDTPSARPEPAAEVEADLYAELLDLCGVASGPGPTKGERATAAKLLAKGYTRDHLQARAARASLADMNPRALLLTLLTEDLNQPSPPPDAGPAVSAAIGGPIPMIGQQAPKRDDDWQTQWTHVIGRSGESYLATEDAKKAYHQVRMTVRDRPEREAMFAFRDAYLAITRGVPA